MSLLNDTELLHEIRDYDLIVYESLGLCATLVAELLDIPNVAIVSNPPSNPDSSMYKVPMPSSYVPSRLLPFSCEMSFTERVINFNFLWSTFFSFYWRLCLSDPTAL